MHQFGQTESTLSYHLGEFVGSQLDPKDEHPDLLRALLGSNRLPEIRIKMKLALEIAVLKSKDGKPFGAQDVIDLDHLFAHLEEIHFLRDRIAHYAVHPHYDKGECLFRSYNIYSVRDRDKAEEIFFRIEDIEAAIPDMKAICARVPRVLFPERRPLTPSASGTREDYGPWRYRPSSLKKVRQKLRTNPRRS
jgi:hypothetical protein